MRIENNRVHHYALWKRSYQPGIFWGGVSNTFRANTVTFGPHNGFLGGGDFADGVNNLFEGNHVADCTFDTIDSGGFYTCGQRGAAFTNRGNILRNNTFARIRNTAGLVQVAFNQAVYLDDQMSGWLVVNNTSPTARSASLMVAGAATCFKVRMCCGTVFYLNNQACQGNSTIHCQLQRCQRHHSRRRAVRALPSGCSRRYPQRPSGLSRGRNEVHKSDYLSYLGHWQNCLTAHIAAQTTHKS